jgi:hypothetical protein
MHSAARAREASQSSPHSIDAKRSSGMARFNFAKRIMKRATAAERRQVRRCSARVKAGESECADVRRKRPSDRACKPAAHRPQGRNISRIANPRAHRRASQHATQQHAQRSGLSSTPAKARRQRVGVKCPAARVAPREQDQAPRERDQTLRIPCPANGLEFTDDSARLRCVLRGGYSRDSTEIGRPADPAGKPSTHRELLRRE